jgi:hypothetical protein
MTRFVLSHELDGSARVFDEILNRVVPGQNGTISEMEDVRDSLNQRVERPELTRADGKLVNA